MTAYAPVLADLPVADKFKEKKWNRAYRNRNISL